MNRILISISIAIFILISIKFNVPIEYILFILSLFLFYASYQIGIKKELSWATLVRNPVNPNETDKNIGKATAIISLIVEVILFGIAIFNLLN